MSLQYDTIYNPGLRTPQKGGVFIALGSNMAFEDNAGARLERADLFKSVLLALRQAGVTTLVTSGLWSSPAWPDPTLPEFTNAVVEVDPQDMDAQALMLLLHQIEHRFGRRRETRWSARTLDLDLVDFRQQIIVADVKDGLVCPHPRAHERSFVMAPLQEIAPVWIHPVLGGAIDHYVEESQVNWPASRDGSFQFA